MQTVSSRFELGSSSSFRTTITSKTPSTHTHTHTHIYIYIYIYIVILWQTVSLYHNSSMWVGRFKLGSKLAQLSVSLNILPLSHQVTYFSSGTIIRLFSFCLTGYQRAQFIRRALNYSSGSRYVHTHTHTHTHTHIYIYMPESFFKSNVEEDRWRSNFRQ